MPDCYSPIEEDVLLLYMWKWIVVINQCKIIETQKDKYSLFILYGETNKHDLKMKDELFEKNEMYEGW